MFDSKIYLGQEKPSASSKIACLQTILLMLRGTGCLLVFGRALCLELMSQTQEKSCLQSDTQ
jgi:hypothetical protein